jgi:hypothetical protein
LQIVRLDALLGGGPLRQQALEYAPRNPDHPTVLADLDPELHGLPPRHSSGRPQGGTATIYAALLAGTDAMIAAKLCSVDPSDASSLITTGLLLASHRLGSDQKAPVTPGEIYPFQMNFVNTAYRLQRGHRLRLSISGADFPHVWPSCENGQW